MEVREKSKRKDGAEQETKVRRHKKNRRNKECGLNEKTRAVAKISLTLSLHLHQSGNVFGQTPYVKHPKHFFPLDIQYMQSSS